MKEKKIIAMFVTSIIAFVASLSISVGVALALADPVLAVGLSEIQFNMSTSQIKYSAVFDPTSTYNGDVAEDISINSYEEIWFENEAAVNQVKLIKIAVTNDTDREHTFNIYVTPSKQNDATAYAQFKLFDIDNASGLTNNVLDFNSKDNTTIEKELHALAGQTVHFVIAAYVSDQDVAKEIVLGGENSVFANISIIVNEF